MSAQCGWCLTGDHDNHRAGGQGWRCQCTSCATLTMDDLNAARAERSLMPKPTTKTAAKHARAMADDPDTPAEHREQWEQQALALEARIGSGPTPPPLFELGDDQ